MPSIRCTSWLVILAVGTAVPVPALAGEGSLIVVISEHGEIKVGDKVLTSLRKGTRLWAFDVKDRKWAYVKDPKTEQKGWIERGQFQQVDLSDDDNARTKEYAVHWERFEKLSQAQRLADAITELRQCVDISRQMYGGDHPFLADPLETLGENLSFQGNYSEARQCLEECLAIRRRFFGESDALTANALNKKGELLWTQGDYAAAKPCFEHALAVFRKSFGEKNQATAGALGDLARLYIRLGDPIAARKYAEQALSIMLELHGENDPDTTAAMNILAAIVKEQGDYTAARTYYERALAVRRKYAGENHPATAESLNNLGELLVDQGNYADGRKYLEQSLAARRLFYGNKHAQTAVALHNLGRVLHAQGDPGARKYFDEALGIYRDIFGEKHWETADTLLSIGNLEFDNGDFVESQKFFDQALNIYRATFGENHPRTALALNALGLLYQKREEHEQARKYYEQALSSYRAAYGEKHPDVGNVLANLVWVHIDEKQPEAAAKYWDQSRRIACYHESRVLPALGEREQMLFLASHHEGAWFECLSFGLEHRADSRIANLSAGWLINGKAVAQEALAEGALLSKPESAPLVEKLRSVRSRLAQLAGQVPTADYQRQLAALETEQQELTRQIGAAGLGFSENDPWVSVATLRGEIRPGSIMINIARFAPWDGHETHPARYVAWVIPAIDEGRIEVVDLGEADKIDRAVAEFRKTLADRENRSDNKDESADGVSSYQKTVGVLANLIWKPIAKHIAGKDELILSPDGALWLVPWGALPLDDGKYVLEKFNVRYLVSGRELVRQRAARSGISAPALFADPDYNLDSTRLAKAHASSAASLTAHRSATRINKAPRLPGTAQEARAIKANLAKVGGAEPNIYVDSEATETKFETLFRPRVLVLSTHGFFLEDQKVAPKEGDHTVAADSKKAALKTENKPLENPLLRCGLLLAGCNRQLDTADGNSDDGVLTGLEIVGTDLRGTELVVLSACETGVGEIRSGEGVAGLRQAFQLAGAQSVVATLWQIPDKETAQLMNDFFVYLSQGKSRSEALRYAQLAQIKARREKSGTAHPYYWAAFTITGKD